MKKSLTNETRQLNSFEIAIEKSNGNDKNAIYELSHILAYSVIRAHYLPVKKTVVEGVERERLITVNERFHKMTVDIRRNENLNERVKNLLSSKIVTFDSEGNIIEKTDKDNERDADKLITETCGEGLDVLNQSYLLLASEIEYFKNRFRSLHMDATYDKTYASKKVRKVNDETPLFTTKARTIYGHAYCALYQYFDDTFVKGKSRDVLTSASYIEFEVENDNGEKARFYLKTEKYADISGNILEYNGFDFDSTPQDAENYTISVNAKRDLLSSMNLTKPQFETASMRALGYSDDAIAKKRGVTVPTVCKTMQRVKERVFRQYGIDYDADTVKAMTKILQKKNSSFDGDAELQKAIAQYKIDIVTRQAYNKLLYKVQNQYNENR